MDFHDSQQNLIIDGLQIDQYFRMNSPALSNPTRSFSVSGATHSAGVSPKS